MTVSLPSLFGFCLDNINKKKEFKGYLYFIRIKNKRKRARGLVGTRIRNTKLTIIRL